MANTAGLAFRRFDTISLIKILLCFYLALAPAVSYASAAPKLDFVEIRNFVRTAGAASADYLFKKSANDPTFNGAANDSHYKTPKHSVTNAKLGSVAFRRILGLTGYGLAAFAVYEIVQELQKDGWTVDPANHEIYKLDGGLNFFVATNGFDYQYFPSPEAALNNFFTKITPQGQSLPVLNSWRDNWTKPFDDLRVGEMIFRGAETSKGYYAVGVIKFSQSKQLATESDVAAVLPRVSDEQIAALMVSPDYLVEGHAPTADAAAAAAPSSQPLPQETSTLGTVKTETQTTTNPDGSTTKTTTTTTTNPDGTTSTQTSTTTTKPDGSTTTTTSGTKPADMPAFCNYAKTLCDWLNWTKAEPAPANPAQNKVDIKDRDTGDIPGLPTAIDTSRIQWAQVCPAPITANFSLMGQSVGMSYKFDVVCDFAAKFRPYVIGLSYLTAAYIVMGLNRTRSE